MQPEPPEVQARPSITKLCSIRGTLIFRTRFGYNGAGYLDHYDTLRMAHPGFTFLGGPFQSIRFRWKERYGHMA